MVACSPSTQLEGWSPPSAIRPGGSDRPRAPHVRGGTSSPAKSGPFTARHCRIGVVGDTLVVRAVVTVAPPVTGHPTRSAFENAKGTGVDRRDGRLAGHRPIVEALHLRLRGRSRPVRGDSTAGSVVGCRHEPVGTLRGRRRLRRGAAMARRHALVFGLPPTCDLPSEHRTAIERRCSPSWTIVRRDSVGCPTAGCWWCS